MAPLLPLVRHLNLTKTQLGDDGLETLCAAIQAAGTLQPPRVGFPSCPYFRFFADRADPPCRLASLDLGLNRFGSAAVEALGDALFRLPRLTSLALRGNDLRPADLAVLLDAVADHPALTTLDLRANKVPGIAALKPVRPPGFY